MFKYEAFRELCYQRGESESRVAQNIGITRAAVTGWRKGSQPSFRALEKLADYFGVDVSYFDDTDEPESKDDSLILGFMEEMRQKNNLTDDERLLLDMFRTLTAEKQSELLRVAMRMKIDSETR